jgi:GxxExxY protein
LAIEMRDCGLQARREVKMPIHYKGFKVGLRRADFLVDNKIMVEIKAIIQMQDVHLNQALNYLEAYNLEIGLLINFGARSLEFKRLHNKKYKNEP